MKYLKRILVLPFVLGIITVTHALFILKRMFDFLRYGGEFIQYTKEEPKTILHVYAKVQELVDKKGTGIDGVTTEKLDLALRMCSIQFDTKTIDKIIDLVQLIEEKGGNTSMGDIYDLQEQWK